MQRVHMKESKNPNRGGESAHWTAEAKFELMGQGCGFVRACRMTSRTRSARASGEQSQNW